MIFLRLGLLAFWTMFSYSMGQTPPDQLNGFGSLVSASFFIAAPMLYFLPTYEAWKVKHVNLVPIAVINLFLGWSLIGWVVAAVWSQKKVETPLAVTPVQPMSDQQATSMQRPTKQCPFCGEDVLVQAIKCKHCHSDLVPPPVSSGT